MLASDHAISQLAAPALDVRVLARRVGPAAVLAGAALTLGLVGSRAPAALGAIPAGAALLAILMSLLLASRRRNEADSDQLEVRHEGGGTRRRRLTAGARLFGAAVRDATRMLRAGDPRLAGAIAYWAFDAAVLWAMLRAFGAAPVLPVIALAYFLGQVANTVPLPGSVSGGMAAVLIASGVPAELVVPAVLAYRALAVWLPTPAAIAAVPALRATIARWGREDGRPAAGDGSTAARAAWSASDSPLPALARAC